MYLPGIIMLRVLATLIEQVIVAYLVADRTFATICAFIEVLDINGV